MRSTTPTPASSSWPCRPFGLDGPWEGRPSTDFTRQALCGGHVQRGTPALPPLMCGGAPGEWAAGTYGAIGAVAALRRATQHGIGDLVDVAALDALMYSQPLYPVTWFQVAGEPFRPRRSSQLPSVHPTADGWVSLQTTTGQQWLDFCVMLGRDDWLADERMARGTYRTLHRDEIEPVIDAWTSTRGTADIVELATAMRVPVAEVGNGANLPHFDHLVDGGWFTTNAHGFTQPSVPYRLGGGATPRPFGVAPAIGRDTERLRARVDATPARVDECGRHCTTAPARRDPGARPHRVLGGTAHRPRVRHPRRRGDPRRVHQATRWHPLQHHTDDGRTAVVGVVPHVPGLEHQQARPRSRARHRARPRALPRPRRGQRRGDRQLQPAGARSARAGSGRAPGAQPERDRAAGAGVRRRRRVARASRLRPHDRGAGGHRVDHRIPRPWPRAAVRHRRRVGRRARDVRAAPRPRAPTPHGTRHVPRVPDGRRVAQPRGAAGDRVLGLRSPARAARQPFVGLRAAGRVPHRRRRRRRHPGPLGGGRGRRRRAVARVRGAARRRGRASGRPGCARRTDRRVVRDARDRRHRAHRLGRRHPVRGGGARPRARSAPSGGGPRICSSGSTIR